MFLSRNKKIIEYPCKPKFYCIKVGFMGVKKYRHVFVMPYSTVRPRQPYHGLHVPNIEYNVSVIFFRCAAYGYITFNLQIEYSMQKKNISYTFTIK